MADSSTPRLPERGTVTRLLMDWRGGSQEAFSELVELVHPELRRIAIAHFKRQTGGMTLEPHAIVSELYLRLAGGVEIDWKDRHHFFAVASIVTRQILVSHARRRMAKKRAATLVSLDLEGVAKPGASVDLAALDEALERLAVRYPQQAKIVELRFFGGMPVPEVAEHLAVSTATVERGWRFARAWLYRELAPRS